LYLPKKRLVNTISYIALRYISLIDEIWIKKAFVLTSLAATYGEVPICATIVRQDELFGQG